MIYIQKTNCPEGLTLFLKQVPKEQHIYGTDKESGFSNIKEYEIAFAELRNFLVQEQGGICCYCQQKIQCLPC